MCFSICKVLDINNSNNDSVNQSRVETLQKGFYRYFIYSVRKTKAKMKMKGKLKVNEIT